MEKQELRTHILNVINDIVIDFLYYDRKEDEDLSRELIDEAFKNGTITVKEVVSYFEQELHKQLVENDII